MILASVAAATASVPPVLCTLLLIAVIILGILALLEIIGVRSFSGSRFGMLIGFIIALVVYVVIC